MVMQYQVLVPSSQQSDADIYALIYLLDTERKVNTGILEIGTHAKFVLKS